MIKTSTSKIGDWIVAFLCFLLILVCLLPMLNVLARSLSSSDALIRNEVLLLPKGLNFNSYKMVIEDSKYTWSLIWTAILTVIGTCVSMFMTTICAYPLIYDNLKGKRFINAMILFHHVLLMQVQFRCICCLGYQAAEQTRRTYYPLLPQCIQHDNNEELLLRNS